MTPAACNMISLTFRIGTNQQAAFGDWQTDLHASISASTGFLSLEILSPSVEACNTWRLVQRFSDSASATLWHDSQAYHALFAQLQQLAIEGEIAEELTAESNARNGITEVLIAQVPPEKAALYRAWIAKVHHLEMQFAGFQGVYVQSPGRGNSQQWITLLQFDTLANLDRWLNSAEREALLKESLPLIENLENHRVISPFSNWFSVVSREGTAVPAWKQTMLVLLLLFPIVMLERSYLPLLFPLEWNAALATFIGNALSVMLITWPMMPLAISCLRWWLLPSALGRKRINLIGMSAILLLYLAEIAIFWEWV